MPIDAGNLDFKHYKASWVEMKGLKMDEKKKRNPWQSRQGS